MPLYCRLPALVFLLAGAALSADDLFEDYSPGLLARYAAGGIEQPRVDADVGFVWGQAAPIATLSPGGFTAEWNGVLLVKSDTTYVARDVSTLYATAKRYMDWGNYEMAAKLFDEVERQHPYSVWARRAQIMSAFNYYLAQKYTDSISSAQRFLTIHPGNVEAPYAHYLIAMSYYQQIADVTRDQAITQVRSLSGRAYTPEGRNMLGIPAVSTVVDTT